ncbi:hypothetical protein [Alsobacter sp. R-9]
MSEGQRRDVPVLLRAGLATVAVLAVAGLVGVVLNRLGAPGGVIAGAAASLVVVIVVASGASGGTMRLRTFITAGRNASTSSVGLAIGAASVTSVSGRPFETALGLVAGGLLLAPAVRASGWPGLAGWLGHRFGDPALRMVVALLLALAVIPLAAGRVSDLADTLVLTSGLSRATSVAFVTFAALVVLLPGGLRGVVRAGLSAALVAVAAVPLAASGEALLTSPSLRAFPPLAEPAVLAAVFAALLSPHAVQLSSACASARDARSAWLGGAVVAFGLSIVLQGQGGTASLFPAIGQAALRIALDLCGLLAMLYAAGVALGHELPGRLDSRRHPASKRFARLRLTILVVCAATAAAAMQDPARLSSLAAVAGALFVAAACPAVILGLLVSRAGRWAGLLAGVAGLATAGLLLEGRLAPSVDASGAALGGIAAGLATGLVLALLVRSPPVAVPVEDAAL